MNARLNSQPARLSLQRTALEEANVMIGILQNDLASLETVMKGKDPFNKVMSLVQLPVDTPGYALVQTVVGINETGRATCSSDQEERLRITSELHQRVDAAFRIAGIVIAFPQRDVHFDASSPIRVSIDKLDH